MSVLGLSGVGDIVAVIGLSGDKQVMARLNAVDQQVQKSAATMNAALNAALIAGASAFLASAAAAVSFEAQMADIYTLLDSSDSFENLKLSVLDLATKLPVGLNDLTSALYQVISATVPADEAINVLEASAKSAVGGVASVTDSFNLFSAIIKGYGLEWSEVNRVSDIVFQTIKLGQTTMSELATTMGGSIPLASTLGISLEEISGAASALTGVTGNTSEVFTQLEGIMTALAKEPTEKLLDAFEALGVKSGRELVDKFGSLSGAMNALTRYTEEYSMEASELLGRKEAMIGFLALTGAQADDFARKTLAMSDAVGSADAAFEKQMGTFKSQADILKNKLQVAFIELGNKVLPVITAIVKALQNDAFLATITVFAETAMVIGGLVAAYKSYQLVAKAVTAVNTIMNKSFGPLGLAVVALTAAYFAIDSAIKAQQKNRLEQIDAISDEVTETSKLAGEYKSLKSAGELNEKQSERLKKVTGDLEKAFKDQGVEVTNLGENLESYLALYKASKLNEVRTQIDIMTRSIDQQEQQLSKLKWYHFIEKIYDKKQLSNAKEQLNALTKEEAQLTDMTNIMSAAGLESEDAIRKQILAYEAMLPGVKDSAYNTQVFTDKIGALYEKLGEINPYQQTFVDINKQLADAGIKTEESIQAQVKSLEELLPFVKDNAFESLQLRTKINELKDSMDPAEQITVKLRGAHEKLKIELQGVESSAYKTTIQVNALQVAFASAYNEFMGINTGWSEVGLVFVDTLMAMNRELSNSIAEWIVKGGELKLEFKDVFEGMLSDLIAIFITRGEQKLVAMFTDILVNQKINESGEKVGDAFVEGLATVLGGTVALTAFFTVGSELAEALLGGIGSLSVEDYMTPVYDFIDKLKGIIKDAQPEDGESLIEKMLISQYDKFLEFTDLIEEKKSVYQKWGELQELVADAIDQINTKIEDYKDIITGLEDEKLLIDFQLAEDIEIQTQKISDLNSVIEQLYTAKGNLDFGDDFIQLKQVWEDLFGSDFPADLDILIKNFQIMKEAAGDVGNIDFWELNKQLSDILGTSQSLTVSWGEMLDVLFQDYSIFEKDIETATKALESLIYFNIDPNQTTVDEQINATIYKLKSFLDTLDPNSQAWQDGNEALQKLIDKFLEMGGVISEEQAIQFNIDQAEDAIGEAKGFIDDLNKKANTDKAAIDLEITEAQKKIILLEESLQAIVTNYNQTRAAVLLNLDSALGQIDDLYYYIKTVLNSEPFTTAPIDPDTSNIRSDIESILAESFTISVDAFINTEPVNSSYQSEEIAFSSDVSPSPAGMNMMDTASNSSQVATAPAPVIFSPVITIENGTNLTRIMEYDKYYEPQRQQTDINRIKKKAFQE